MRKIKGSGSYLKNQVQKNIAKATLSLLLFCTIFFAITLRVIHSMHLGFFELVGLLLSIVPLVGFYYYLRKYQIYRGGWTGEKQVIKVLTSELNDDYYILNDLYLHDGSGDIDHIVLGPNGVFVLETKNWSGSISCNGDEWHRIGKRNFSGSPSRQVKRNSSKIKYIIDNSSKLRPLKVWVEGIVVFTNNRATFHFDNPTVPVLKLSQLPNYIKSYIGSRSFSSEQLEAIAGEITKQNY